MAWAFRPFSLTPAFLLDTGAWWSVPNHVALKFLRDQYFVDKINENG
jgi:hypothetical protein